MKAHADKLTRLMSLNGAVFNIPVYQRNYDWKPENCMQLFDDLETIVSTGKPHFIGSIVYIPVGSATSPSYNIIDGQQRITSVMLLLKAIYTCTDNLMIKRQITANYLVNANFDGSVCMRLKQIESDGAVYDKLILMESVSDDAFSESERQSNVYKNYSYFVTRVMESETTIEELLIAINNLDIIDVCLDDEDPQAVFESLNSTGKSLTNTDLLRNYLLMAIPRDKQELLYKQYWAQIEKNVGLDNVEQFMTHYLMMKRRSDEMAIHKRRVKLGKGNIYDAYKIYCSDNLRSSLSDTEWAEKVESLLKEMFDYSIIYKRIVNGNRMSSPIDTAIYDLIYTLNASPVAIFLMYLLYMQPYYHVTDDEMLMAITACTSYIVRRRFFGNKAASTQFFSLAIQQFEKARPSLPFVDCVWTALVSGHGSYSFPSDKAFQTAVETKDMFLDFKSQMISYVLYKYESRRTKELVDSSKVSIEHIMPQNLTQWEQHLKDVKDSEYEKYIHKIGNLTLTKYNSELSNDPFEKKKEFYVQSGFYMTREIARYPDWTSTDIKNRSLMMAKEALKIWPLPPQYNSMVADEEVLVMDESVEAIYENFHDVLSECYPLLREETRKLYTNYKVGNTIVICVIPVKSCITVNFGVTRDLLSPNDNLEDISTVGHWGVGKCRMKMNSEDDIWQIVDYIEQICKVQGLPIPNGKN